jgi:IS1 family transposase
VNPEHISTVMCRSEELDRRRGLTSELDEMWSYVRCKANPRWLWHAIDHHTGKVLAYVFERRQDDVFPQLKALLAPFGITRFYTDGWGAYERHLDAEQHHSRCSLSPISSAMSGFIRRILCSLQRSHQHADFGMRSHLKGVGEYGKIVLFPPHGRGLYHGAEAVI